MSKSKIDVEWRFSGYGSKPFDFNFTTELDWRITDTDLIVMGHRMWVIYATANNYDYSIRINLNFKDPKDLMFVASRNGRHGNVSRKFDEIEQAVKFCEENARAVYQKMVDDIPI